MRGGLGRRLLMLLLRHAPLVLLAAVLVSFEAAVRWREAQAPVSSEVSWRSPRFLSPANLMSIAVGASSVGIVAAGMTVVLLSGGIDLSVGAIMYVAAAVAATLLRDDLIASPMIAIFVMVGVGLAFGLLNGSLIAHLAMLPFVVTLATLYAGRGLGFYITQTRALHLPADLARLGYARVLGVPFPVIAFAMVVLVLHVMLGWTPFGRQLYALGDDGSAAEKAGIRSRRIVLACYAISGVCAAVAAVVSLVQLGTVSPTFGRQREFEAIAAAVLGGTSLFGGRGSVLPGTVAGAILIQSVYSGLVAINANQYVYPLITCGVIFVAVMVDVGRNAAMKRLARRGV